MTRRRRLTFLLVALAASTGGSVWVAERTTRFAHPSPRDPIYWAMADEHFAPGPSPADTTSGVRAPRHR